ncbi:hypothetical protein [Streptomyces sp. NPDC057580]|uniref:hypothetical protein n=1 Tax=Streptomyces sp. NPDC057580 TaxID=3346173 RepID=UPI0036825DED
MTALARRHAAALRTPPLPCGKHRDPVLHQVAPHGRSTYGLAAPDLAAELFRLAARGWQPWEITARLDLREVTAA